MHSVEPFGQSALNSKVTNASTALEDDYVALGIVVLDEMLDADIPRIGADFSNKTMKATGDNDVLGRNPGKNNGKKIGPVLVDAFCKSTKPTVRVSVHSTTMTWF